MNAYTHPASIAKELIPLLNFEDSDVLRDHTERIRQREKDLDKALVMGNADHNKVIIVFEDRLGVKQVETTIWGITHNHVILKKNSLIPIKSIHRIEFV